MVTLMCQGRFRADQFAFNKGLNDFGSDMFVALAVDHDGPILHGRVAPKSY